MGTTLVHDEKPLGFYTRKLSGTQRNYTVGEKDLLGIIKGLKAFAGIMHWRLLLEEYNSKVKHIADANNDGVDTLSRLDLTDKADDPKV